MAQSLFPQALPPGQERRRARWAVAFALFCALFLGAALPSRRRAGVAGAGSGGDAGAGSGFPGSGNGDPALAAARAQLEARGLHVRESTEAVPHGRSTVRLRAEWPELASGPTARRELDDRARTLLERAVAVRRGQPPTGRCPAARSKLGRYGQGDDAHIGDGGVAVQLLGGDAQLVPQGPWGKFVGARRDCDFGRCFDSLRAACQLSGPLRVLWYARPPAGAPSNARAGAATGVAELQCSNAQCEWARLGIGAGLVQLVTAPEDACVFVATDAVLRKIDDSKCIGSRPCTRRFDSALAHWGAAGAAGRNHLLLQPQCAWRCDLSGENPSLGQSGR
ncbi:hypothetical protein T492DRAFT_933754 [Pavlovales sp. CCMP2436]|nr:hypothetical protein T492DRAFT_933754 [Pavlovales sp. CCMP2436]